MAHASPLRSAFNAGELSPLVDGRVDIAKYNNGVRRLENFIPAVQGPAVRRAGTRFVAEVKNSAHRTWLTIFEFSVNQSFVLEFGNQYIRFFANRGQVLGAGNAIYEIASPYAIADLTDSVDQSFTLDMAQTGDIIYIAHKKYPLQKLSRYGNTNWTITPVEFKGGPFKDQNIDKALTVYASATTGNVTLTASGALFSANMVGSLFYMEPKDLSAIKPWAAGQEFSTNPNGQYRRADGKTYQCVTNGTPTSGKVWRTGGVMPIHTYGTQADGDGNAKTGTVVEREGLEWTFIDSGRGYVKITGFTSPTEVSAVVQGDYPLPISVVGSTNATFRWAKAALSASEGQPSKVTFFRERLTLAKGQQLFFSVSGDFENFSRTDASGNVVPDRSIVSLTLASDQTDQIEWLVPGQALLIGTSGAEFACSENSSSEAFAPANVKIEQQTSQGSRAVRPLCVGYSTLFVQRSGRKLQELAYNFQQNGYIAADMTVLCEHITLGGIQQLAWHKEPYAVAWAVRGDGALLGFTFNKEQDVVGWHRHTLGGAFAGGAAVIESVAVIPSPDKTRDDLWLIVKRTINGQTRRYVEWMEREYRTGDAQADAFYVDSGLTYSGSPATTISGLSHLEGQAVSILADGAAHPDRVVTGGAITLQFPASKVQIGFGFVSTLQTTRLEAGAQDGTAQGKTKRINRCSIRFLNTLGAFAGTDETAIDELQFRSASDPMDRAPPLFSGDKLIEWPGGYDGDGWVMVQQRQPLPMTIIAIMPQINTYDRA